MSLNRAKVIRPYAQEEKSPNHQLKGEKLPKCNDERILL